MAVRVPAGQGRHSAAPRRPVSRARVRLAPGLGHSSVSDAVAFALAARAQRLLLFHHDPLRSDIDLAKLEARARELWTAAGSPTLAREGMCVDLADEAAESAAQAA
jgi:ribonuclease BN (tRNA processing enzyme)